MSKLKVLVPLDGTEASLHSIDWIKKFFGPEAVEITLMNVLEVLYSKEMFAVNELENLQSESMKALIQAEGKLAGYAVKKVHSMGFSSDEILKEANHGSYDMIIMAKSSVRGLAKFVGSVTTKVIRNSHIPVVVVPE